MNIEIKWQNKQGEWQPFDVSDIECLPRSHAIDLFSQGTGVIIKEGNANYIVNRVDLYDQYKRKRQKVTMLSKCERSEGQLSQIGFIGDSRGDV